MELISVPIQWILKCEIKDMPLYWTFFFLIGNFSLQKQGKKSKDLQKS